MRAHPLEADAARLADVLERACAGGKAEPCRRLADLVTHSPALPRDEARATALLVRSCSLGEGVACLAAASQTGSGEPSPEARASLDRARTLLEAHCNAGDGAGCLVFAVITRGLDNDTAKAAALETRGTDLLEASCRSGAGDDCLLAGREIAGHQGKAAFAREKRLAEQACDLGVAEACMLLAVNSPGLAAPQKVALLQKSCDADGEVRCLILGKNQIDDDLPPGKVPGEVLIARGFALARARCNLADTPACDTLASSLVFEATTAEEAVKTVALLEVVCDRRVAMTCSKLADGLADGPEALRDPERVKRLKTKACAYGYPFACPDPARALHTRTP